MKVPLLDLKQQYAALRPDIDEAMRRVVESQYFILGPEVEGLEREVAAYCQCEHAVGVTSGTDALLVALMAICAGPGDEVITSPYTFFATVGSICRVGARPVFADIDPLTFNIDPRGLDRLVTERTRAIIPVHLYGQTAEMEPIMKFAERHSLTVIEDAAQAIGAEYRGRRAGSIGHIGCFSFFPSKNLGAFGDGGMLTTNDPAMADEFRLLRNQGHRPKYFNKRIGGNFRLDALQAAVLRVKLPWLDSWTEGRQRNALAYRRRFVEAGLTEESLQVLDEGSSAALALPYQAPDTRHIFNQFVISVRGEHRPELIEHLKGRGIGSEIYYPIPAHLQECLAHLGYSRGDLPASERAADQTLALPVFPELSSEQMDAVVDTIGSFFADRGYAHRRTADGAAV